MTDSFHIGLVFGMEKTALSQKTWVEASRRRGVSPSFLKNLVNRAGQRRRYFQATGRKGHPGGLSAVARQYAEGIGSDYVDMKSGRAYLQSKYLRGGEKVANEIPDRIIAAAITGAFLGSALADRPEDRKRYMIGGALAGGFLSHKRMQSELRRGFAQVVS